MKIIFILCIQLSVLSNFGYSQTETTETTDTTDLTLVSPKLFGCKCYEKPDTINYGLFRPLDNDYLMIQDFNDYLMNRYQLNEKVYSFGIPFQIATEPKGELLKDIWIDIALKESLGYEDLLYVFPLCAFEKFYLNEGSDALNEELKKMFDFGMRNYKTY